MSGDHVDALHTQGLNKEGRGGGTARDSADVAVECLYVCTNNEAVMADAIASRRGKRLTFFRSAENLLHEVQNTHTHIYTRTSKSHHRQREVGARQGGNMSCGWSDLCGAPSLPPSSSSPSQEKKRHHNATHSPIERIGAVPLKPHPGRQEADKEIQN